MRTHPVRPVVNAREFWIGLASFLALLALLAVIVYAIKLAADPVLLSGVAS